MKNIAIYAGSFDPLTKGHMDIILRGAQLFDQIVVGVAKSVKKNTLFSLDERVNLTQLVLSKSPNICVKGFDGLLVDFAKANNANVILRGIRSVADFDYEFQLDRMNKQMCPEIETMFLLPTEKFRYISSSLVKEIASFGKDVTDFVAPEVADALIKKLA